MEEEIMERMIVTTEEALVEVVADILEATVGVMSAEIESLEEMVKDHEGDVVELLDTCDALNDEVNEMAKYICKLEKQILDLGSELVSSEIKVALLETILGI